VKPSPEHFQRIGEAALRAAAELNARAAVFRRVGMFASAQALEDRAEAKAARGFDALHEAKRAAQ
jgi:hypothetical protein